MIISLTIISTLLAILAIAVAVLAQAELWQRKEYRLDRLLAALRGPELRNRFFIYALQLLLSITGFHAVVIAVAAADRAWIAVRRGVPRPLWTVKAAILVALTAAITVLTAPALKYSVGLVAALAFIILLVPLAAAFAAAIANGLGSIRQQATILRAARLRRSLPHLTVIGITGSFGKTSTKHFLSQLLPEAVASREHRNSEFPIAQDMLLQLTNSQRVYIVEMAAYRRGEIAALARLAQPQIGVITAIGNQHLATFGSLENIALAKWELIGALPENGTAILNKDDDVLLKMTERISLDAEGTNFYGAGVGGAQARAWRGAGQGISDVKIVSPKHPKRILTYSMQTQADVYAEDAVIEPFVIRCRLHIGPEAQNVTIPLAGRGALSNVLAAAAAAYAAGANARGIFTRVKQLTPYPRTMEISPGIGGSTIINDSYSAHEHGVLHAIKHLALFPHRDKRIALVPLIELGAAANEAHQRIGQALQKSGAKVYIYGTAHQQDLGVGKSVNIKSFTSPQNMVDELKAHAGNDTVFLLEGRVPEVVRRVVLRP